jgi:hypothetical protein
MDALEEGVAFRDVAGKIRQAACRVVAAALMRFVEEAPRHQRVDHVERAGFRHAEHV